MAIEGNIALNDAASSSTSPAAARIVTCDLVAAFILEMGLGFKV